LSSDVPGLFLNVFASVDSMQIKINKNAKSVRNIQLKKIGGLYYTTRIIDAFDRDTSEEKDAPSYILLLNNRNDTSFVITYPPSSYPSIPAESEDCSITIKKFNSDVYYTKKTSLLDKHYFDLYFYDAEYRIIAILYSRINKQYLFVDKKADYLPDIMSHINTKRGL